jgi:tryptophan-rich sensory protein
MHPAIVALLICAGAAVFEGAVAGRGTRARLAELRQPRFSPPLNVWIAIAGAYYLICFGVLYRLLAADFPTAAHRAAFILVLAMMVANGAWGYVFFRLKNLRAGFLAFIPYGLLTLALALVLARIDRSAALLLLPYLAYFPYALWWGFRVWMLNRSAPTSGESSVSRVGHATVT